MAHSSPMPEGRLRGSCAKRPTAPFRKGSLSICALGPTAPFLNLSMQSSFGRSLTAPARLRVRSVPNSRFFYQEKEINENDEFGS